MIHRHPDRHFYVYDLMRYLVAVLAAVLLAGCFGSSDSVKAELQFKSPQASQLSMTGDSDFVLATNFPEALDEGSLTLSLNGQPITPDALTFSGGQVSGEGVRISGDIEIVDPGIQELRADVLTESGRELSAEVTFETAELQAPAECEVLNQAECMLPYPSSRFLEAADTPTGVKLAFPENGTPTQNNADPVHLSPEPYRVLDGYSPTVQALMHFQGAGVDVAASDAPRILAATRTTDDRSLEADSPTVLIDAVTGERIHHWVETDVRAEDPARQTLVLRPGQALEPGRRYIIAVRDLVDVTGSVIEPEPAFAALRDGRPTDIEPLEARRESMEDIFADLGAAGIPRDDLLLAFDFVVQSEAGLTFQMQAMLDETMAEIAAEGPPGFTVEDTVTNDCSAPDTFVWREVIGTYEVPLYLDNDPEVAPEDLSFLVTDEDGNPQRVGTTSPPFTIAIPCAVLDGGEVIRPMLIGHGLFGTGRSTVRGLVGAEGLEDAVFIGGATDFRGLSSPDINPPQGDPVIIDLFADMDNFAALPDRLRQGMLNTLVLGHMMKQGHFNTHPAFQTPGGEDVFPGPDEQMYYFGGSLGGIMGTMYSALTSDADKLNVDVPAINFSLMLQRATPFSALMPVFESQVNDDFMQQALILGMIHELWVRGEPAGYMSVLRDRLAAETPEIDLLITVAWLDQQVTNLGAELIPRTLGVPQLIGSFQSTSGPFPGGLPLIEDQSGPLRSAYVVYDTGLYDLDRADHEPFIPPLTNQPADTENSCNPHGLRGFIPASVAQLANFFQPGGRIENFCEGGVCDGSTDFNSPLGDVNVCDPVDNPNP